MVPGFWCQTRFTVSDTVLGVLDVKVKTKGGTIINIEIQVHPVKRLEKRLAFYLAKLIVAGFNRQVQHSRIWQRPQQGSCNRGL